MGMRVSPIAHLTRITTWANTPERPVTAAPFAIEAYGERWIVGASRHFAVAVRGDLAAVRALDDAHADKVRETLFPALPDDGRAPGSSLAALKEWCGPVDWPDVEPCPQCKCGADKDVCNFCDGVGTMIPAHEQRPGWIGDVLLDRAFLAWALEPFDDERVAVCSRGPVAPFHVIGKSWIVTVMPRRDRDRQRDAPHLLAIADETPPVGVTKH